MARKHKSEPMPFLIQSSRLAAKAKTDLWVGGISLVTALVGTWWFEVPLTFNADTPAILLPVFLAPFGVFYLVLGAWSWVRHRKSGGAWLEYRPMRAGGTLTGFVRLNRMPDPLPDFTVTMRCRTRAPDDSSTDDGRMWRVTWTKEVLVKADSVRSNNGIVLAIALPPHNHAGPVGNREWELQVRAPLPGLNFYQEFRPTMGNN